MIATAAKQPFEVNLEPARARIVGGYAGGPGIDLQEWANTVFGGEVSGAWLCVYLLRRFGWPNAGSDDYKELCSWTLTTPVPGLFLAVTPYLGGSNLHFAVRYTGKVGEALRADPGRDAYFARRHSAIDRWWKKTGRRLYVWGGANVEQRKSETLVYRYSDDEEKGIVWGFWKRRPEHKRLGEKLPPGGMVLWSVGQLIEKTHPEVKLPKMRKREQRWQRTRFHIQVERAIKVVFCDLLRPTNVRDISFTPFGDVERAPEALARLNGQKHVTFFEGAGYAPEYWFKQGKREVAAEKRKRKAQHA